MRQKEYSDYLIQLVSELDYQRKKSKKQQDVIDA